MFLIPEFRIEIMSKLNSKLYSAPTDQYGKEIQVKKLKRNALNFIFN
jgi:hypothetical protein